VAGAGGLKSREPPYDDRMSGVVDRIVPPANIGERGKIRRRVRYLRKLRELQLRDLGGFALEQRRLGRERPDLMAAKLEAAAETDRELRALERALSERRPLRELREPGIGGACQACGTVHGSSDRYCGWCGQKL
jgi:hypothetical protein